MRFFFDMDRILGKVRPASCPLSPCSLGLIKVARAGLLHWMTPIGSASLLEDKVPSVLKEAKVRPLLNKKFWIHWSLENYRQVLNIPSLGKLLKCVMVLQLQGLLKETDYLEPFQSRFRLGCGSKTALVALVEGFRKAIDRGSTSLLIFLDLSEAFNTLDSGNLLERPSGLRYKLTDWL